jgi:hypothetical protein
MKRRITILLLAVLSILTATFPQTTHAANIAGASANFAGSLAQATQPVAQDNRAEILRAYLQTYNSPLADHAETFIQQADKNQLDWKLVAAISGVESYYGQMIPPYSYNGWGFGVYGTNVRYFTSWDDGIIAVSTALRQEYMNQRGATNVYEIGSTYAAERQWANKVMRYSNEIDAFAKRFAKPTLSISL